MNDSRCAVCGWPLAKSIDEGCIVGNCSMRPMPKRYYDPERAAKEYHGQLPPNEPAPSNWISVKDRLPLEESAQNRCVLVWTGAMWLFGRYIGGEIWHEDWAGERQITVTHWQPLPSPPVSF